MQLSLSFLSATLGFALLLSPAVDVAADDWVRMKSIVPRGYVSHFTSTPIDVDGHLQEDAWRNAPWTEDFGDIEGDAKPRPRFRTRAKMLWDARYFYIAAELEEPHVWATLTKRDSVIFHDNDFEVFIDPNGDNHEYYELELNALNTVWDLFLGKPYKDGGPAMNNWDVVGLKTGVHIKGTLNNAVDQDAGWTLEIALPWKVLRQHAHRPAPPREGDQWRVNFSRVEWDIDIVNGAYQKVPNRPEYNWVWSPQGIIDMHRPERWGYVQFTKKPPGTVTFVRDPSEPTRELLMEIYHAQREFRGRYQRWAESVDELGLRIGSVPGLDGSPVISKTADGYQASAAVNAPNGRRQWWHVRQDSKLWSQQRRDDARP